MLATVRVFTSMPESYGTHAVTSPWDSGLLVDEEGLRPWGLGHSYPPALQTPNSFPMLTLMHEVLVLSLVAIGCCLATASERQVQGKVLGLSNLDVWRGEVRQRG